MPVLMTESVAMSLPNSTPPSPEMSSFPSTFESRTSQSVGEISEHQVEESMGRTRGNFHAENNPLQRSLRKKNPSGGDISNFTEAGLGAAEEKGLLYHCNYCNKDITGKVRIKCHACLDFDLCVECFSVGAEVTPHKSDHPYKVMSSLSFSIISPDWNAEEEMLLVEGLDMYGPTNWTEVAEHVATKSKEECIEHYNTYYLNSPNFMPEFKNTYELLAMGKDHGQGKKGTTSTDNASESNQVKGSSSSMRVEDHPSEKSFEKGEGSSLMKLSGYNPKRNEFDIEYDNEAEKLLADMEFNETDTAEEREIKLRMCRVYSNRLEERQRRKDFIMERGLLHPNPIENDFTPEEKKLCRRYDVFMRFHSKEDHDGLLKTIVEEHRALKRLEEMKAAQAAGCRTRAQAEAYIEVRRRLVAEDNARMAAQSSQSGSSSKNSGINMPAPPSRSFSAVDLLSEAEKRLCHETGLAPEYYLKMQQIMTDQIFRGKITKKSDAYSIFRKVEPMKVDMVYDMLVKKGIAPP